VRATDSFHVAKLAREELDSGDHVMVLLPTVEAGAGARADMRSLGYMGSFLLQYASAQVGPSRRMHSRWLVQQTQTAACKLLHSERQPCIPAPLAFRPFTPTRLCATGCT
jgi:hypothetical protein